MTVSNIFESARAMGIISAPQIPQLPAGAPIVAAMCAVKITDGCQPPIGSKRRIASGCGKTKEEASLKAMGEAIELYCLQYKSSHGENLSPFFDSAQTFDPIPAHEICLGHPDSFQKVYSGGSAAWPTLDGAIERAAFELFEKCAWQNLDSIECFEIGGQHSHSDRISEEWLASQFRQASFVVVDFLPVCQVILCRLTDLDGGRPTYGSASGTHIHDTKSAALSEAIFHWFNQTKFEALGTLPSTFEGQELEAVKQYRGAQSPRFWPLSLNKVRKSTIQRYDKIQLLEETAMRLGQRCRAVDMSDDTIGISVVRLLLS